MAVNFHSFIQTDEWARIVSALQQMEKDYINDIVIAGEKGKTAEVMHLTGRIAMIKETIHLPEFLYSREKENAPDKKRK